MAAPAKKAAGAKSPGKSTAKGRATPKSKAAPKGKVAPKGKASPRRKAKTGAGTASAKKRADKVKSAATGASGKREAPGGRRKLEQPLMAALRAEHKHMASIMELFKEQLAAIERGGLVDTHVVYEIMDYMISWPDRYHHPREDLVYGRVAELDANAGDNVDSLQREHDKMAADGRALLKTIEAWREGRASGAEVVKGGRNYVDALYRHMNTEETVVFPQVEQVLRTADWRDLADEDLLKPVSDPVFGGRVDREFRNMARKLRRGIRRSVERGTMAEWIGLEALMEALEVMSMAMDSCRNTTGEHLRAALDDSRDYLKENPVSGALRSAANNTRLGFALLGEMVEISRDALEDLSRVNQERKDRLRMMDRNLEPR